MPKGTPPNQPTGESPTPEEQRNRIQLIFGKLHGLFNAVVDDDLPPESEQTELIRQANAETSVAFGDVQNALNTGQYDNNLARVGLTGRSVAAKENRFIDNVNRYYRAKHQAPDDRVRRSKFAHKAIKVGVIIIGSLGTELQKVKGMEFIKEGGEILLEEIQDVIDSESPTAQQPRTQQEDH